MSRTFADFQRYWPRKFSSIWPNADALRDSKNAWYHEFAKARMTEESFKRGLDRARQEKWPPDNPGEFLALCRIEPGDVGAPDFDKAWRIAIAMTHPGAPDGKSWKHPCVRAAAKAVGFTKIFENGEKVRRSFDDAYQNAVDWADEQEDLPVAALPQRKSEEELEEAHAFGSEKIQELKQFLGGSE